MRFLFFIFLAGFFSVDAQVLPQLYRSDWSKAGVEGGFLYPSVSLDIISFGAIPNDGLSDDAALTAAMAAANGLTRIYFPAGVYNFSASINLPDSVLLTGENAESTFLEFDLGSQQLNCINFWGSADPDFHSLSGGYSNGSFVVSCAGADSIFAPGDYVEIRQLNGSWDTNPAFWAEYAVGHLSRIDSVAGDNIYLADALRISLDSVLLPEIHRIDPVTNSAIECFRISRTDSLAPGVNYAVYLYNAWNCRVSGIESVKSIGAHVMTEATAHCEIIGCYFQDAYTFDGNNTRGVGVIMSLHSCSNKIENNVFRRLRHAMMIKQGANGNVFGYNYSLEVLRTEFPSNASGDISVHGHYPYANLFEGNVCQNINIDQAWGPSGPRNLFFRNRAELYGFIMTPGTVQSDSQAVIGNTISSTMPLTGFYLFAGGGHFEYGNSVQGLILPSGTSQLNDSSYYLDSVPAFFTPSLVYPAIGTGSSGMETNPAEVRFDTGNNPAVCNAVLTGTNNLPDKMELIRVHYSNSVLTIFWSSNDYSGRIRILDTSGKMVKETEVQFKDQSYSFPVDLQPGLYLVQMAGSGVPGKVFFVQ